jgi:DNA-binding transcriptional LysR family regulator
MGFFRIFAIKYLELMGKKTDKIKRGFMDDINGIISGVESGLGKAILPLHLLSGRKHIQVVKGSKKQKSPVYLCFLRQPFYTRLQMAVIDALKENSQSFLKS